MQSPDLYWFFCPNFWGSVQKMVLNSVGNKFSNIQLILVVNDNSLKYKIKYDNIYILLARQKS